MTIDITFRATVLGTLKKERKKKKTSTLLPSHVKSQHLIPSVSNELPHYLLKVINETRGDACGHVFLPEKRVILAVL